jgi:hypothetical protein
LVSEAKGRGFESRRARHSDTTSGTIISGCSLPHTRNHVSQLRFAASITILAPDILAAIIRLINDFIPSIRV